jgi:hypothetical protein
MIFGFKTSFYDFGGDMASTWVAKPEVHAEGVDFLVNPSAKI